MTDLFRCAEENGVTVEYCSMPRNSSISVEYEFGNYVLMDYMLLFNDASAKTHFAHELGHCVTGSFYNLYSQQDVRKKHENKADKWAIRKLISEDELDKAVADGRTTLWDLADYFGVTEDFMKKAVCLYTHGCLAAELYF